MNTKFETKNAAYYPRSAFMCSV